MDKNIAIQFDGVGKQYRLGLVGTGSLQHDLNRWWQTTVLRKEDPYLKIGEVNDRSTKGNSDYVWALKDISFKVEQGDVVGIIGKNGAGKSTLLKLLSHITAPSTGTIDYRGRIASLLEVGTGFHPEMTARENIYMNGSIMGMTRHEITRKLDEIVEFAGIERYIDTPVKRFSSGMTVRLGFAVAAFLEPEILVVDEVLAVGDAEFQKKAIGKMQDVSQHGGRTVLFVSHNMASIKQLCHSGVLLENGMIKSTGNIKDVIDVYISDGAELTENKYFDDINKAPGNENIRIKGFEMTPLKGNKINVESGIHVKLVFLNKKPNTSMDVTFEMFTIEDIRLFHTFKDITINRDSKVGYYTIEFDMPPYYLNAGKYKFRLFFGESQKYLLWGSYWYTLEIENTLTGQGYNLGFLPGILKPRFDYTSSFQSID